jgi:hypothetical protein
MIFRRNFKVFQIISRRFSKETSSAPFETATTNPTPHITPPVVRPAGSTFLERLSACFVGIAIGYRYLLLLSL